MLHIHFPNFLIQNHPRMNARIWNKLLDIGCNFSSLTNFVKFIFKKLHVCQHFVLVDKKLLLLKFSIMGCMEVFMKRLLNSYYRWKTTYRALHYLSSKINTIFCCMELKNVFIYILKWSIHLTLFMHSKVFSYHSNI